jgi:hypothetical protein
MAALQRSRTSTTGYVGERTDANATSGVRTAGREDLEATADQDLMNATDLPCAGNVVSKGSLTPASTCQQPGALSEDARPQRASAR